MTATLTKPQKKTKKALSKIVQSLDPKTNREAWLANAAAQCLPLVEKAAGQEMPKFRITTSFPSHRGTSKKKRVIGECWPSAAANKDIFELLISPLLEDPIEIIATIIHEMLHAAVGLKHGHDKVFWAAAKKAGLRGKPTATVAGPELIETVKKMTKDIGFKLPVTKLGPTNPMYKKQTTRMVKCTCGTCGYVARTTRKWIEDAGAPICPSDKTQMKARIPDELLDEDAS